MAVLNMKVEPNTPISRSLGFNPRGVIVDNVTQYWLFFPQTEQYCPPFTVGWSAPIILNPAGYGYMELKTPFGESNQTNVTPNVGQFVSLVWTDSDVAFSPGQPAGTGSSVDPTLTPGTSSVSSLIFLNQQVFCPIPPGVSITPAILPPPGKRLRIYQISINYSYISSNQHTSPVSVSIWRDDGSLAWDQMILTPQLPLFERNYFNGLVLPVNEGYYFDSLSSWASEWIDVNNQFQYID